MFAASSEQLFLEGSKSPELAAALDLVADTEAAGEAKFSAPTCRLLGRMVVCRNYASAILELCHLVVLAEACGPRARSYEDLFWASGPARPGSFRSYLKRGLGAGRPRSEDITLAGQEAAIRYPDGRFAIAYSRMPALSALMEFLVTVLGYAPLDELWDRLFEAGPSAAAVSKTANEISKQLYDYLNQHLGSLHGHRQLTCLIAFLKDRGDGDFASEDIDDETVLALWLSQAEETQATAGDFRTFGAAFKACLRLRQALDGAREAIAMANPRPIGSDRARGEVDPAQVMQALEAVEDESEPLELLRRPPADRIKFLTKTETGDLALLVQCGRLAPVFALSVIRAEVFGAGQGRISQALRRGLAGQELAGAIAGSTRESYDDRRARFDKLDRQVGKLLLAALFVLVMARRAEAISLILAFRPNADLRALGRQLDTGPLASNVIPMNGADLVQQTLVALAQAKLDCPELSELMVEAKRAYQAVSRQGFAEADLQSDETVQGFAVGIEALGDLGARLRSFCQTLEASRLPAGDWAVQFAQDREIFESQFHLLYGAQT